MALLLDMAYRHQLPLFSLDAILSPYGPTSGSKHYLGDIVLDVLGYCIGHGAVMLGHDNVYI